jgi:hypothetical protein
MGLPQHHGAFSTLRLASPVQETSNSRRSLRAHTEHLKVGNSKSSRSFRGADYKKILLFLIGWKLLNCVYAHKYLRT